MRVEIGYALLPLVKGDGYEPQLEDQVKALRRQMALDYGFVLPSVRITDNFALQPNEYVVFVRETEAARGEVRLDRLLVINPGGGVDGISGEPTEEPVFKLPALWVERSLREEAGLRGLTVVDGGTIITTHLTEVVKDNISDLLSYTETQKLLSQVHSDAAKLVEDVVPAKMSMSAVQRVLQNLLAEGVSIRDIPTILEGLAEAAQMTGNLTLITEHVRARLSRQISTQHAVAGSIPVLTLSPAWEAAFAGHIVGDGDERQLAMPPATLQAFIGAIRERYDHFAGQGEVPCLLTNPGIRPYVRSIIDRLRPSTVVLSQNEIHARARVRSVGMLEGAPALADSFLQ